MEQCNVCNELSPSESLYEIPEGNLVCPSCLPSVIGQNMDGFISLRKALANIEFEG